MTERDILINSLNYCDYLKEWLRQNATEPLPGQDGFKAWHYLLWIDKKHLEFRLYKGLPKYYFPNNKSLRHTYETEFKKWLIMYIPKIEQI